jgi:hypothetical protein
MCYIFPVLVLLIVVSCTDDQFLLTNKWQLREYQYPDGTTQKVDSVFYNFQKGSFMAICLDEKMRNHNYFGNYYLDNGELSIKLFEGPVNNYLNNDKLSVKQFFEGPVNNSYYKKFFDWPDAKRRFQVEEISPSVMRLNHEGTVSIFRRY